MFSTHPTGEAKIMLTLLMDSPLDTGVAHHFKLIMNIPWMQARSV